MPSPDACAGDARDARDAPRRRPRRSRCAALRAFTLAVAIPLALAALGLAVLGCGAGSPPAPEPRGAEVGARVDEARARAIAAREGEAKGYDPADYRLVSIQRVDDRGPEGAFRVSFEHLPPTPPGGHFVVFVDVASGAAELVHGR